eukprot:NODE_51_length_31136_cov_0.357670.p22 type:complete len:155 gc:universal NODE_51_length_31136_cov_0.357670:17521-17057(-)
MTFSVKDLSSLEISDITDKIIANNEMMSKEVCGYLIEHPKFYDFDVVTFPHYNDVVKGILENSIVESSLKKEIISQKTKLLALTFNLNEKMRNNENLSMKDLDESLVLEAMQVGLIKGKIGENLQLEYCRPSSKQPWLKSEIVSLRKRLMALAE